VSRSERLLDLLNVLRRPGAPLVVKLGGRALEEGASAAWLQVEADNSAARALYAGTGFAAHHSYHHYRSV
jgi:predicted GNAT family acetyltransferase